MSFRVLVPFAPAGLGALLLSAFLSSVHPVLAQQDSAPSAERRVVFVAGAPSHGYGSHEHFAGSKVLAETLAAAGLGIETEVYRGWPQDRSVLDRADAIVIYSDGGGGHVAIPHREHLQSLMAAGKGLVCIHYAVEVPKGEVGNQFLDWLGGYFETDWSVNPHWDAIITDLPQVPVTRGVRPFKANDEWYFHMRFRPQMEGVTSILHAVPPESTIRRPDGPHSGNPVVRKEVAEGIPQTLAWTFERPDGGRSFGYTGGHFHWNWGREDLLQLVCNAIVWTAHGEVPSEGVAVSRRSVRQLQENQDFETPADFNPLDVAREFMLLSLGKPSSSGSPEGSKVEGPQTKKPRELFASKVINTQTPGHRVAIKVPVRDVKDLFLVVTDAGDGFACDWADWVEPRLVGPQGTLRLTELKWKSAQTQWGEVRKNLNAGGQPMSVAGAAVEEGIGTHANSVIHFEIPSGYDTFLAEGTLDTGGTSQGNGGSTSVTFAVFADAAPLAVGGSTGAHDSLREPENAVAGLEVPDDLQVTLACSEPLLYSLTNLDIDDAGRIWVIDVVNYRGNNGRRPEGDRILILEDTDQDGVIDQHKVFYQGRDIDSAMGLCVLGNEVIVSAAPYVWRFIDRDGDDVPDEKRAMFTETGVPQHDHSNHSFLFGPDGKLYWNVGNTGQVVKDAEGKVVVDIHGREIIDNGKPFFGGMPFRCELDGSKMEVLAHNFRNNWETTVDSFGTLWQSDNDDDGNRGVRINFVMEHGNYGYRDTIDGSSWQAPRIGIEQQIPERHWHLNDPGVVPNLLLTGAGSPTGITVYEGRLLPERFWDQVIHCDAGPNVVRCYAATSAGAGYSAEIHPLVTGTVDKWFRPADVCVAPDGSLFVSDWYDPGVGGHRQDDIDRGRLFRIAPPGSRYVVPKFDYSSPQGAAEALRNPNYAVRYKAWQALHAMGRSAEDALVDLWNDSNPRLRARALWLLGKIPGREAHWVQRALEDENPDLRIVGLRLARQTEGLLVGAIGAVTADRSPAVLREAAIALRFCDCDERPSLWASLAMRYEGGDRWYLEALGIGSEGAPDECFAAWLDRVGDGWDSPANREIVWRVRAKDAAMKLGALIAAENQGLAATDRYFRALEFHPAQTRRVAMEQLINRQQPESGDPFQDAILVRALERAGDLPWQSREEINKAVLRHIERNVDSPDFLSLVKRFQVAGIEPRLLQFAKNHPASSEGVEAMEQLMRSGAGTALLKAELQNRQDGGSIAILLALLGSKDSVEMTLPWIEDSEVPYETKAALARALASTSAGGEWILRCTNEQRWPAELKLAVAGSLQRNPSEDVRKRAEELFPLPSLQNATPLPTVDQLAAMRGDPAQGKVLYQTKGTCANCHLVSGEGKQVGPDLSQIGSKLSREAMYVSILDPSAGISHNYENYVGLLDSGSVISGILVNQTEALVVLRTAEGLDREIPRKELESLTKSTKSIMPENLHHALSQQELIDIVEYLTTLRAN